MRKYIILVAATLLASTSNAALLGRAPATPGGTDYQAYYDTNLDITWLADANLAASNTFGVAGVDPAGWMNWFTAQAWIAAMNSAVYLGFSDWRLTRVVDTGPPGCDWAYLGTDCGFSVDLSSGEMANLYYSTLGNLAGADINGNQSGGACLVWPLYCLANTGPFSHLPPRYGLLADRYWSGTYYVVPDPSGAWAFNFISGEQSPMDVTAQEFVWAIRDGDVDTDGDGIVDHLDNCINVPNADQRDADGDGYGNACDADLDNNGAVTITDFAVLRDVLGQSCNWSNVATTQAACNADLDANGSVTVADFAKLRKNVGKPPGPSGLHPNCPPTCQ